MVQDASQTASIAAAFGRRYGVAPGQDLPWNATIAGLLDHRSVRAYLPTPLPPGTLETLIAAAQSAPSSSNLQTWSVVAVEDKAKKARLAECARSQKHVEECPLFLVFLADLARLEALGKREGVPTEGLDYLEMLCVAMIDAALAAQNAVVALESLGLGSVYIGAIRNRPVEVAQVLGLPPNVMAVFGLCVGYADPARPAQVKPRLPQEVVLHHETYGATAPDAPLAHYEVALKQFQEQEKMPQVGWSATALDRVRAAQSLSGRDRLRDFLATLGFGLK